MNSYRRIVVVHSPFSTRANYYDRVRGRLVELTNQWQSQLIEVELCDLPYGQARQRIKSMLQAGDLVVAAGGDGIAQVTFDAIYRSKVDAVFATIPLGNGNDVSRAINGQRRTVRAVLSQPIGDFYPLNIATDGRIVLSLISYVTFGATTILVDYLNQQPARRHRRMLKHLTPAASVPVTKLAEISRQISDLNFPDFIRDKAVMTDDSIGFFLIPAAHRLLRLPKDITWASSEFFFHHAMTKDRSLAGKIIMAGAWAAKFPGQMTELEELNFGNNTQPIIANVSGDNINLGPVQHLSAIRSTRPVKVMANLK